MDRLRAAPGRPDHGSEVRTMDIKQLLCISGVSLLLVASAIAAVCAPSAEYDGRFCSGKGGTDYLRLIDQSFEFFHPNPHRQNISMLYLGKEERLVENHSWYMWWVQNSYGPTFCALPYLREPWLTALQNAQDLWFKYQGDGKTASMLPDLIAPEGSLCDCAGPTGAIYVQGDCDWKIHDWFYEAAAAGVVMQGEILLISRDLQAIGRYMPNLDRACSFIEERRDPKNNLFLVGPAANLLAPSYGGVRQPDGTFGRGYLAGLSVNYLAALDRMVELSKLMGDTRRLELYKHRQKITRESLPLLLTDEGYFCKSMETDGVMHGVYGQEKWGYFEVAPNVDAVCFRAVDDAASARIVARIRSIPQLRPNGMLITNYPSLDDTYQYWGDNKTIEEHDLLRYGRWVNGGVWTTMEARAVMAYSRTGRYADLLRSAAATWAFAREFQLDAPLPDFGKSVWFATNSTNLCYDSLGVPAAVARGLFEYIYKADSLTLYPHIPPAITEYSQKEPIRFGDKRITISVKNGGPKIVSLKIDGKPAPVDARDHVVLRYADLPARAKVELVMAGGWPGGSPVLHAEFVDKDPKCPDALLPLPQDLAEHVRVLKAMQEKIAREPGAEYERVFLAAALQAYEAYQRRATMHEAGLYARVKSDKHAAVMSWYREAAQQMYSGFETMMARCSAGGDAAKQRMAGVYAELTRK